MAHAFKQAVCNEMYGDLPLEEVCRSIRSIGYQGIEIAPFTLAENPSAVTAAQRRAFRNTIQSKGLTCAGLHWLLASPKGLHVSGPDRELRGKSWRHVDSLIDLCADLCDGGVMVFGSPSQRATTGGISRMDAMKNFTDGLSGVAEHAAVRGVTILVEALPRNQCDVINTLAEAVAIVEQIGSPAVRTMFDTHNAVDETEPHADLVDRYFEFIRHVHVNEIDGRHPGTGDYDFKPILAALQRRGYQGWISLEAFDFTPGAERIAADSLRFITKEIEELNA